MPKFGKFGTELSPFSAPGNRIRATRFEWLVDYRPSLSAIPAE